jgi:uncharacterized protein YjbI with pentapeptide repeats
MHTLMHVCEYGPHSVYVFPHIGAITSRAMGLVFHKAIFISPPFRLVLEGGSFEGRRLEGGSFEGGSLEGRSLKGSSFEGGSLEGGRFEGGSLEGGSFEGRNLERGNFEGKCLEGGSFEGAETGLIHFICLHISGQSLTG